MWRIKDRELRRIVDKLTAEFEREVDETNKVIERLRRVEADINVIKKILHTMLKDRNVIQKKR